MQPAWRCTPSGTNSSFSPSYPLLLLWQDFDSARVFLEFSATRWLGQGKDFKKALFWSAEQASRGLRICCINLVEQEGDLKIPKRNVAMTFEQPKTNSTTHPKMFTHQERNLFVQRIRTCSHDQVRPSPPPPLEFYLMLRFKETIKT